VPARVVITAHQVSEATCAGACAVGADVCVSKDEIGNQLWRAVGAVAVDPAPLETLADGYGYSSSIPTMHRPVRRGWMPLGDGETAENPWWHGVARHAPSGNELQ
jgi:hypothetical protein